MLNVEDNFILQFRSQPLKIKKLAFTNLPCSRHRAAPDVTFSVTKILRPYGALAEPPCNSAVFTKIGAKNCLNSPKFPTKNWVIVKNDNGFAYCTEAKNSQLLKTEIWNNGYMMEKMGLESFLK